MQTAEQKEYEGLPLSCAICWKSRCFKTCHSRTGVFPNLFHMSCGKLLQVLEAIRGREGELSHLRYFYSTPTPASSQSAMTSWARPRTGRGRAPSAWPMNPSRSITSRIAAARPYPMRKRRCSTEVEARFISTQMRRLPQTIRHARLHPPPNRGFSSDWVILSS